MSRELIRSVTVSNRDSYGRMKSFPPQPGRAAHCSGVIMRTSTRTRHKQHDVSAPYYSYGTRTAQKAVSAAGGDA
eukprot:scaffold159550_cov15-Prasinocladus_malaysianus.AAC.1